ncbi:hypothetical protein [Nonomuraea dietziae]|uniref:hypothetical protein n=1 Tax=Nonomuraea dietziae TaxID=65515 RepID=UPI0031CDF683
MVVIRRREAEAADEFAADHEADNVIASLRDPDAPHQPGPPARRRHARFGRPRDGSPRAGLPWSGRDGGGAR